MFIIFFYIHEIFLKTHIKDFFHKKYECNKK